MPLFDLSSKDLLLKTLFPLTTLITPNKSEFELLANCKITSLEEGIAIAKEKCKEWNTSIFLKGGHFNDTIIREALITEKEVYQFKRSRKVFSYQHGTGCTISTAFSCYLGQGMSLKDSYSLATEYLINLYSKYNNE
jgi:hydroxymethylpyrimidine/phosphomethylpyrimidine kinase